MREKVVYNKIFEIGRLSKGYCGCTYSPRVLVELEVRFRNDCIDWETLKPIKTYSVSLSGTIACGKTALSFGQIDMELKDTELISDPKVKQLLEIWDEYHLNDLKAGTKRQEEFLKRFYTEHPNLKLDYDTSVKVLKENNLLIDNGYKYGTRWLCRPISKTEVDEIIDFFEKFFKKFPKKKYEAIG